MSPGVEQRIRDLAAPAHPTADQMQQILRGWEGFFFSLQLMTDLEQEQEFDGIMRARVRSGVISIVAPGL